MPWEDQKEIHKCVYFQAEIEREIHTQLYDTSKFFSSRRFPIADLSLKIVSDQLIFVGLFLSLSVYNWSELL